MRRKYCDATKKQKQIKMFTEIHIFSNLNNEKVVLGMLSMYSDLP